MKTTNIRNNKRVQGNNYANETISLTNSNNFIVHTHPYDYLDNHNLSADTAGILTYIRHLPFPFSWTYHLLVFALRFCLGQLDFPPDCLHKLTDFRSLFVCSWLAKLLTYWQTFLLTFLITALVACISSSGCYLLFIYLHLIIFCMSVCVAGWRWLRHYKHIFIRTTAIVVGQILKMFCLFFSILITLRYKIKSY